MSQLAKSLEKRIQELTASIESQKTELAAYERVLHMEISKGSIPTKKVSMPVEVAREISSQKRSSVNPPKADTPSNSTGVAYTGNKTLLIAEIVKSHGASGATPKEVDAYFSEKGISRSKNLIYNTLSYLVAQKKLQRRNGKYLVIPGSKVSAEKAVGSPKTKKRAVTKRKLSPEGLKRIKDALKRRWAAKRAADEATEKK